MTDFLPAPKRRGRPPKNIEVPDGMPVAPDVKGAEREAITAWMRQQLESLEAAHAERVELLRTVGEHPSPIFQKLVRNFGGLGMAKTRIAKYLNLTPGQLALYYDDDYEMGKLEMLSKVASNAIRIATSVTDPAAAKTAMDILARRGEDEWRPPAQKLDVSNDSKEPPMIDGSKLNYEDRQKLREIMMRALASVDSDEPGEDPKLIE